MCAWRVQLVSLAASAGKKEKSKSHRLKTDRDKTH